MYDTIHFWLARNDADADIEAVANKLEQSKDMANRDTGEVVSFGKLDNLKVAVSMSGVSIKGSLAKFYLPDNTYTLNRQQAKEAIEKLSDSLSLSVDRARITRIDISTNFVMRHPAKLYFDMLGDCRYYNRQQATPHTLYYHLKGIDCKRSMCFYDKAREVKAHNGIIPDIFVGENLLRYESRWCTRLAQQFKEPEITGATLYNRSFYIKALKMWGTNYFSIQKKKQLRNDAMNDIRTVKDATNFICAYALGRLKPDEVLHILEELKANKVFKHPEYYTQLKRKINSLCSNTKGMENSDLIKELDSEIKNILVHG